MPTLRYALAVLMLLAAGAPAAAASAQTAPRQEIRLADGWRFIQDNAIRGAEAPSFDDSGWSVVSVPHTWNRVGYYIPDPSAHIHTASNVNKAVGLGWYRLRFPAPAGAGKRAWLQFDAASRVAEVWLNGLRLGEHSGGFSRFRFDATAALRPGGQNVLVVKTDNTVPAAGTSTADSLPLAGDFFVHGGLYRPVSLILTDPVHFDMLDFGGPGVYATTTALTGSQATISVESRLRNDNDRPAAFTVLARLLQPNGSVAAEATRQLSLAPGASAPVRQSLSLPNARLWQGVEDPFLYTLKVEILGPDRRLLDEVVQPFGVRQMRFDADKGFFLNGKPLRLQGVGYHQDREGKGWAIDKSDVEADLAMMREMGANTIRLTHYQHGHPVHEVADRLGLILWDEIPLVTRWTLAAGQANPSPELLANARQQLQELIRQNFNHPSVAVWGIANEVDFGAAIPGFIGAGPGGPPPDPMPLLRELNALAKAEDPGRPTALATCCEAQAHRPPGTPITSAVTDLGGANRYYGWYLGKPEDLDPHLEALRAARPRQPLSVTEYGAGGATTMHTDHPLGGIVDSRGAQQPEEYMSYVHEKNWEILSAKPYLWATWLWNSFDFATTIRREGDSQDINTKGLVTYDREVKKDAFYFYKANWTTTPTVHITGRRYVDRAYAVTDVRVYSNAASTELSVNGRRLGAKASCPLSTCVWSGVRLAAGRNELTATGRFRSGAAEDRVAWRLEPAATRAVRIDAGALMAASTTLVRFGSDAFFEGGEPRSLEVAAIGARRQAAEVTGVDNPGMAKTYREGVFRYRVPLPNGRYSVKLTFVEPSAAAGARSFDVLANGAAMLTDLDVAASAGAPLTAVTRSFEASTVDGRLDLVFRPKKGDAIVSGIEIVRAGD